jgi:DNA gyrase/topoisomerase IV subunit B
MRTIDQFEYADKAGRPCSWYEFIRLRAGMYLGQVNHKGFLEAVREIMTRTIAETRCDSVAIELSGRRSIKIRFDAVQRPVAENWALTIGPEAGPWSGIYLLALNALSAEFSVRLIGPDNDVPLVRQHFRKGELAEAWPGDGAINCRTIELEATLDPEVWTEAFELNGDWLAQEIRDLAFLYRHVRFELRYRVDDEPCRVIYHYRNGLRDCLAAQTVNGLVGPIFEQSLEKTIADFWIEAAFAIKESDIDGSFLRSYVNDRLTHEHGTHVDGLLLGLCTAIATYIDKHCVGGKYHISAGQLRETLFAVINIRTEHARYAGATRNKMANEAIIQPIADEVAAAFLEMLEAHDDPIYKLRYQLLDPEL